MGALSSAKGRILGAARAAKWLLGNEDGQGASEYAIVSSWTIILGAPVSLFLFGPRAIELYNAYIHGFYLVLGLPVP